MIEPDRSAGIGVCRLSIIDVEHGHQPIPNEDDTLWTVLNGEIYNFRELREDLGRRHRLATGSDTEVLVHLYEDYGLDLVDHLRGMFAFAVWDRGNKRLVVARDRLGEKPLYVAFVPQTQTLLFGSEIKALLVDPDLSREMDPLAMDEYLTYGFVPTPRSIYQSIAKLPAGCRGIFDSQGWRVERYWSVRYDQATPIDKDKAVDELESRLTEAVRMRLISEVPLGVFLGGGLDSSVITAIMSRLCSQPVRTFTIGFPDPAFDESSRARFVAKHCKTEHTEQTIQWDVQAVVPLLARHFDEPFADSSAVPTYEVSRLSRPQITVALTGEGGDEIFAGYNRYQACKLAKYYQWLPRLLRPRFLESLVRHLPTTPSYFGNSFIKSASLNG